MIEKAEWSGLSGNPVKIYQHSQIDSETIELKGNQPKFRLYG